jgi:hypothetical protein
LVSRISMATIRPSASKSRMMPGRTSSLSLAAVEEERDDAVSQRWLFGIDRAQGPTAEFR